METQMEPRWINRPPTPTEFAGLRLIRVGTAKQFEAIITSEQLTGCITHFWKRRTTPCSAPDCPACRDAVPGRWHGYLSVLCTRTRTHFVLELTALAAVPVAEFADAKGSLRGAMIVATRLGNKANGPVQCTVSPSSADLRTLPRAVHMEKFLRTIWNLDTKREDVGPKPPRGQNIRNTLPADPPTSPTEPLRFPLHPLVAETRKSNGKPPAAPYVGPPQFDPNEPDR